jgi:hypothetical protein
MQACADAQGTELRPRDVLLVRAGWLERFSDGERDAIEAFDDPGVTYTDRFAEWIPDMEIPSYASDTLASERTHPESGVRLPLHSAFIRDRGILITEILRLDELAADCTDDGQ